MNFLISLLFGLIVVAIIMYLVLRKVCPELFLRFNDKSAMGYYAVDLKNKTDIKIKLGEESFLDFESRYIYGNIVEYEKQLNNRYSLYRCELVSAPEDKAHVIVEIGKQTLDFTDAVELKIGRADDGVSIITVAERQPPQSVTLEQRYDIYKKAMQKILDMGAKNYFYLSQPRYKKENYSAYLKKEHVCIAPELIQFEEFKEVITSEEFECLRTFFYIENILIHAFYDADHSLIYELSIGDSQESLIGSFGQDDLFLDRLTEEDKKELFSIKLEYAFEDREEAEKLVKEQGFEIDESYVNPFLSLEDIERLNLRKERRKDSLRYTSLI